MKQFRFLGLTLVVTIFATAALTQAGAPATHTHHKLLHTKNTGAPAKANAATSGAAIQRWRLGGATHWRSQLLQR